MQIFLQINRRIVFRGQIWERVESVLDELDDESEITVSDESEFGFQIARTNLRDESTLESFDDDDESDDEEDDVEEDRAESKGKGADEA